MSQTLSPSFARCYGLARVARVWKISRASVYRSLKETPPNTSARRPGPVGACSDAELADHIRRQIAASRLHGEGYRKLWARLRFAGVRASPRRVRRVMRENGLLAPHRVGRTEAKPHDGTIITDKVNEMWGTDMTQTITIREGTGQCLRRRGTRQFGSRRHSCIAVGQSLRGPGAGASGGASVLRSHRARGGAWIEAASRSWLQLHVRRFPGRNRMPGDRSFALLRARARGQRRRRALHPNLTWGRSGQGGRIRVTSADLQYLFGIRRSEPDCMTRLVSEHDQPHIRSPRETAAPISRLRRSGLRKTRPFLKTGFLGHVRMRFVHLDPPGLIKSWKI